MKKERGFSLIELLIVVVVIGTIAAIAIPNLLAARRQANEASAISSVRILHGAQNTFAVTMGWRDYAGAPSLGVGGLKVLEVQKLIDPELATGSKHGYEFKGLSIPRSLGVETKFLWSAIPTRPEGIGSTGTRRFGVATDGVVRYGSDTTAGHYDDFVALARAKKLDE